MGLVKKKDKEKSGADNKLRQPSAQDMDSLLELLNSSDAVNRRQAVHNLDSFPEADEALCAHLAEESDPAVQEAIFTVLIKHGGREVVKGLIPYLRSSDAALRNKAVEALQALPKDIEPHVESLLVDDDPDVRIFTINIIGNLSHPSAPVWLQAVLERDDNINVCATAVDVLAEVGTGEQIPTLQALAERLADEPFITFAVNTAIKRIENDD